MQKIRSYPILGILVKMRSGRRRRRTRMMRSIILLTKDCLKMRKMKFWMMTTIVIPSFMAKEHLGAKSPLEVDKNLTLHLWVK